MAKLRLPVLQQNANRPSGRIILVSAINPTRAGEGKTTISIGLAQGMQRLGARVALALREPSLGPIFGIKGGGTGGGRCQLEPSTRINMHFTGDIVTMPGLSASPAAQRIDLSDDGEVLGV
jgi:formate--tetrahydrofolate ligase